LSFDAVERRRGCPLFRVEERIAISADARRRGDDVEDEDGDEGKRRRLSRGVATWRVDPAPLCVSSASHPPSLPPAHPVLLPPSCLLFGLFSVCSSGSPLFSLDYSRSSDSPPTHCITVSRLVPLANTLMSDDVEIGRVIKSRHSILYRTRG